MSQPPLASIVVTIPTTPEQLTALLRLMAAAAEAGAPCPVRLPPR